MSLPAVPALSRANLRRRQQECGEYTLLFTALFFAFSRLPVVGAPLALVVPFVL